jgi:hypothetical protein
MGLIVPTVGQELGPAWANDINADLGILDQHNHSNGEGVQITPAGLNINIDLSLQGNNLTEINGLELSNLSVLLPGALPYLTTIYAANGNLYFNDGAGNQVKITSGGAVNATSSGISSGTATASFVGGVLVVDSNVNTPANIQGASILIGNNVSGSNFVTLQAQNSLASSYSLTLPLVPSQASYVTIDTSGNMAPQAVGPARSTGTSVGAGGVAISNSCGNNNFGNQGFTLVTNLSVTLTTTGRPVMLMLQDDGSGGGSLASVGDLTTLTSAETLTALLTGAFFRGTTQLSTMELFWESVLNQASGGVVFGGQNYVPVGMFNQIDFPSAGTYTYTFKVSFSGSTVGSNPAFGQLNNAVLVAYEI